MKELAKKIAQKVYTQGDNFFAIQRKGGKWEIGYTNDYPLQHGNGESCIVPESLLKLLNESPSCSILKEALQKISSGYDKDSTRPGVHIDYSGAKQIADEALSSFESIHQGEGGKEQEAEDLKQDVEVLQEMIADLKLESGSWIEIKEGSPLPDYDEYVLWAFEDGTCAWDALDKDGNPWLQGGYFKDMVFVSNTATHYRRIKTPSECDYLFNIK